MALTDNIIGCWSPSISGGGGAILPDLSGRNNHGTLTGMSGTDLQSASVYGRSGRVMNGDATDNRIATAQRLPTSSMTYGGWVLARNLSPSLLADRPFGEADAAAGTSGTSLLLRSTGAFCVMRGGTAGDINASTAIANNVWYLFVIVLGARGELYQNGVLVGTSVGTTIASRNIGFQILNDDTTRPALGLNGLIGEVCVWSRAITQPEVLEWFRRGNGSIGQMLTGRTRRRTYGKAAGFKAYWARRQGQIIGGGT